MNPMPSGEGAGQDRADTAELGAGSAAQGANLGRAGAMLPAGAAAAGEAGGRAGTGAEAAVHAAATVGHGGLAAVTAAAGARTAARGGQEVARAIAVPEMPASVGGKAANGRRRIPAMNPMPSGRLNG